MACRCVAERAREHFVEANEIMARCRRRVVRAPRIMGEVYRQMLDDMVARGWSPPRRRIHVNKAYLFGSRCGMRSSDGTVHIIGAGMAGLAAAVRLAGAGRAVAVHEATQHAGGRCRSYYDHATGMLIDNGTHLLLSGNHAALAYVETVGSARRPQRSG